MAHDSSDQVHLLTLDQLNKRSTSAIYLQMLRCLNTSDLAFTYMLLKPGTLLDICNNALNMLQMELEGNCHYMTIEEHSEFYRYITTLAEFATQHMKSEV